MAIKKKKKSIDLLVFVFIIAIMLTTYSSYSRYTSSSSGSSTVSVAAWNVKVNSQDITNTVSLQENMTFNILNPDPTKVASGKIAPSSIGYFDISIDTSSAEVAARYTVTIDLSNAEDLNGITLIGYEEVESFDAIPGTDDLTAISNNASGNPQITGEILLNNNVGSVDYIRVYLEWQDAGTEAANSAQTSIASSNNTNIAIPIDVVVEQLD